MDLRSGIAWTQFLPNGVNYSMATIIYVVQTINTALSMVHRTGNHSQNKLKDNLKFQAQQLGTMFYTLNNKSRYPTFEELTKTLGTYMFLKFLNSAVKRPTIPYKESYLGAMIHFDEIKNVFFNIFYCLVSQIPPYI